MDKEIKVLLGEILAELKQINKKLKPAMGPSRPQIPEPGIGTNNIADSITKMRQELMSKVAAGGLGAIPGAGVGMFPMATPPGMPDVKQMIEDAKKEAEQRLKEVEVSNEEIIKDVE